MTDLERNPLDPEAYRRQLAGQQETGPSMAERRRAIQAHLAGQRAKADQLLGPGEHGDGLAKLLAFRFGVPRVEGEQGWRWLTDRQRQEWQLEADMVRGYLVNAEGWRAP